MQQLHTFAPAKINAYLRIVGRRPDGYHLLDSLMVPVSLCDEIDIQVELAGDEPATITLSCSDPAIPADETNLAYKAAALLCRECAVAPVISLSLKKRIPAGAGLGGGSSNAAAVLKSLNTLLALNLTEHRLCQLGARLGADVPFFIPCRPSRVEGIGEILTPVPPLPHQWVVLVVPPFGVLTKWAYERFDELPSGYVMTQAPNENALRQWPTQKALVNDLERAIIPAYPQIATIKSALRDLGAESALMSGSGSAVFGLFFDREQAEKAAAVLKEHGRTFLAEPLSGPCLTS
jgi:4-diphosphocytidyl-2-C-methyl-D-erythritol kinase